MFIDIVRNLQVVCSGFPLMVAILFHDTLPSWLVGVLVVVTVAQLADAPGRDS